MRYLFVLLFFWTLSAAAQAPLSKIIADKLITGKNPAAYPAPAPPDPANLAPDWWRYFEVDTSELKDRIVIITRQLKHFPEDENSDARKQIDILTENLQAFLELRKKTGPESPESRSIQKTYTLRQWLDIIHKQRTVEAELQSENQDLLINEKRFNTLRQRQDSLTATYLAIPVQTSNKATQGLVLMAAWSELAINRERFRLRKLALALLSSAAERLAEENTAARNRLFVGAGELQRYKQEIESAERELASAHENASQLAASPEIGNLETDEGKARSLLFEQKVRHAAVKEAIAETVAARKHIELQLALMITAPDKIELKGFRKQLQDRLSPIVEISGKIDLWREEAERDQGRAGMSLASLFGAPSQQGRGIFTLNRQRLTEAQNTLLSLQRLEGETQDTRLVSDRIQDLIANREGALKSGMETVKTTAVKILDMAWKRLGTSLFKIGETPVTLLGILRVVLIINLAWAFSYAVRRGLTHLSERQQGSSAFLYTLGRLAHYLILIIGISIGISSIGVDLSNFALIAGALSLGVGFGMQAIVSNFVSGLILLFERSLRIGDFVELSSGEAGEVRAVNVRSTLVTTTDMVDILVPNSEFVNGKVINWTLTDASRRIHIPFGIAYGSDKDLVRKAGLEAAERTPYTLKNKGGREPEVWLINFGDSSLDFELVVWVQPHAVKKPQRVRAAYYWELETALKKYGIKIPFPQRDIHLYGSNQSPVLGEDTDNSIESERL